MKLAANPYQFSNPVYRPGEFFDRQFAVTRLVQAIQARRSVQLTGQYRIGKSSLLRYMHEHLVEFLDDDQAIPIYYDLSRRPHLRNGNDFFARLLQLMSNALVQYGQPDAALPPGSDLADPYLFDDFLNRWVEIEGFRIVFFLDEFGVIARSQKFDLDFFDNLRSTIPTLNYVLGTPRSLADYAHEQVVTSPLWNKLQLIQLTLFERREIIQELIRHPIERVGLSWSEEAEEFIYKSGGQFPCYIQMAASALYDTQEEWRMNFRQAEKVFRDTATEHFRHLWTRTLYDQYDPGREEMLRGALLDLVHGRNIDDDLAEDLESRSLVWRNETTGLWEPFSAWFAEWLRQWSTDSRVKVESERKRFSKDKKPFDFQIGHLLDGAYHIEEALGVTNNSYLIKAFDERLHRTVAIKFPRLEQESQDEVQRLRENLLREARILARLDHKNIGAVYQVIADPLGIVMAWIDGVSLDNVLDSAERMLPADVIKIGIDLSDALSYVHERDIVHRDIKPSNIILNELRGPVLVDFNIARHSTHETISRLDDGSFGYVGTASYSAPEQFLNPDGVGSPTDLFALGIVLYKLLTGEFPYEYGNLPSLYGNEFPKLKKHENVPEPLYSILSKLLDQQPAKRPNAITLRLNLQECLNVLGARNDSQK